jgi:hypothetical protein
MMFEDTTSFTNDFFTDSDATSLNKVQLPTNLTISEVELI